MSGKTVAIVGKGPTADLANESDADEFWTVTHAWRMDIPRIDRVFEPHPYDFLVKLNAEKSKEHVEWLKQEHDYPIYMQKEFDEFPASVKFPLQELMGTMPRAYAKSSIAYAMIMAIQMDYEIELYGIEMAEDSEWRYQRPNMAYLIGYYEGKTGKEVVIPGDCGLIKDNLLYGYDRSQWVSTDMALRHKQAYERQLSSVKRKLQYAIERLEKKPNDKERQARAEDVEGLANRLQGGIIAVNGIIADHIPESGWLDRSSVVVLREGMRENYREHLAQYNSSVGEYKKTRNEDVLMELVKNRGRMWGYEGAVQAMNNLLADVDLREPLLEIT